MQSRLPLQSSPFLYMLTGDMLWQVNAIESANMNLETMVAMKQGANVLKSIHGNLWALSPFLLDPRDKATCRPC